MANGRASRIRSAILPRTLWLTLVAFALANALSAQENAAPYTIHVTTSLFQIPTLVLSHSRDQLPPIAPERFRVRIDGGKPILPKRVRLEGDDPLSLGVLIDLSGPEKSIVPELPAAFSALQSSLRPQDRLYLYAADCVLIHNTHALSVDVVNLGRAVQTLIDSSAVHANSHGKPSCYGSTHFMDALGKVVTSMSKLPGRRVLLTISNGDDDSSHLTATNINFLASRYAVAIFGLSSGSYEFPVEARVFPPMCERSGGMALRTKPGLVATSIQTFIDMIRGRYIVEFQRQLDLAKGEHIITVEISKLSAFIRPAGTSAISQEAPIADDLKRAPEEQHPASGIAPQSRP